MTAKKAVFCIAFFWLMLMCGAAWAQDIPQDTVLAWYERFRNLIPPSPQPTEPVQEVRDMDEPMLQSPLGTLHVRTMPSSYNGFTGLEEPYAWPGRNFPIWGNVTGDTPPFTFMWEFGDGSAAVSGAVSNPNYIYAYHSYSTVGTYFARLIVTDNGGTSDTATVRIRVDFDSETVRRNAAIEDGLRWLYLHQGADGRWNGNYPRTLTASAVAAFEVRGHFPPPVSDPTIDIYADRVQLGLNYIFSGLVTQAISMQTHGNPDSNGNGVGIRHGEVFNSYTAYSQGIIMFAIANSRSPNLVATTGPAGVIGRTYKDILTDMVDQLAYSQTDSGSERGGWRYSISVASYGSDNSAVQWAVIALRTAEAPPFSIAVPQWVKDELLIWTNYSQCSSDGSFGYTGPCYSQSIAKTGAGLYSLYYLGIGTADTRWTRATGYICNNYFNTVAYYGLFCNNFYAMYAVKKALEDAEIEDPNQKFICGRDWMLDFVHHLVKGYTSPSPCNSNHQLTDRGSSAGYAVNDGRWPNSDYWFTWFGAADSVFATTFPLLILIPGVIPCVPQPNIVIDPPAACPGTPVCFDGSGSSVPSGCDYEIVQWLWDLDNNGSFERSGQRVCVPEGFTCPLGQSQCSFTVNLKVTSVNAQGDTMRNTSSAVLHIGAENHAPIAVCGGPYTACVGEPIHLDGCASYDPDHDCTGDSIVEYCWNFAPPGGSWRCWPTCIPDTVLIFNSEIVRTIQLRVRDTHGLYSDPNGGTVEVWSSYKELSVLPADIVFTPNESCDTVEICATIHAVTQRPDITIESAVVDFYVGSVDPANRLGTFNTPVMRNGDVATFCLRWVPPADSLDIYVVVDPNQLIRECNERDNVAVKEWVEEVYCHPCVQPILSLVGYRTVSWVPPLWTVQVEVRNAGPGVAMNVNVVMNEELPWLTIPDPSCSYGEITEGATSFGGDVYVFDLTNSPGGAFNVWFDVTYEDACGNPFRVRLDPEFDPTKTEQQTVPVTSFKLAQNYPNPFNPNTTIGYQLPVRSMVNLSVFDVSGRLVRTLVSDYNEPGLYAAQWDGKDNRGVSVASGIYFYKFQAGSYRETKRMVLLR